MKNISKIEKHCKKGVHVIITRSREELLYKIIFHLSLYDYYDLKNIYNLLLKYDNEMGYRE